MNPLRLALHGLRRNLPGHLGMLLLASLVLAAALTITWAGNGLIEGSARMAAPWDLVIGAPGSESALVGSSVFLRTDEELTLVDEALYETVKADPLVQTASPFVMADNYQGSPIIGLSSDWFILRFGPDFSQADLVAGRPFREPLEAVVGAATGLKLGDHFKANHGYHEEGEEAEPEDEHHGEFIVTGVLPGDQSPWDKAILVNIEDIHGLHQESESASHGAMGAILVKPRDFAAAYALRTTYRNRGYQAVFPGEVLSALYGTLEGLSQGIQALVLGIGGLVVLTFLLVLAVQNKGRQRELALYRSLGASRRFVVFLLWTEASLLLALILPAGLVLALIIESALSSWLWSSQSFYLSPGLGWSEAQILLGTGLAAVLGALSPTMAIGGQSINRRLRS